MNKQIKLSEIVKVIESNAPPEFQESYDNAGLSVGDDQMDIHAALLCVDITCETIDEAVKVGANLIISHHPLMFNPIKNLNEKDPIARIIVKAVRNNIAIYSAHTNLDNIINGVNDKLCHKLNLKHRKILSPLQGILKKLVVFVPLSHAELLRTALFDAGAGKIGSYDQCSFNTEGFGTFRGSENSNPYVGEKGTSHHEKEIRIETVFPVTTQQKVIQAMLKVHPYEEVAYDIYPLENAYPIAGSGMIGELEHPVDEQEFLRHIKKTFHCEIIRHSPLQEKPVKNVAVCGGSGSFLIEKAIKAGADIFITADLKYHDFFKGDDKILLADIGHYESEQCTIELLYEILTKKIHNFAIHFSKIISNPIKYY